MTRHPAHRNIACTAALVLLAGCTSPYNPFSHAEEDYAKRVALERLRDIRPGDIRQYQKPPSDSPPDTAATVRRRFEGLAVRELTLEECRKSTLENNLNLKVAFIDPAIAAQRVSAEDAAWEATFQTRAAFRDLDSATASELDSAQSEFAFVEPGVTIPMRTGGSVTVALPMARNETDNQFSTLNPAYTSDLAFSISHNLLRNAGRRVNTTSLRIAGYNQQASETRTKLEVIRQLAAADRAYWRMYQAREELKVRQQQYEVAAEQLARAQRRVNAGSAPEIEVTRAQAGVSDRLTDIISVQNVLRLQQRELKRILNMPGLDVDSPTMLDPKTQPDPVEFVFDAAKVCEFALAQRMEMLELELQLAADAARIGFQRDQMLPLFTLDYTYRVNGLGGTAGDSFDVLRENKYEDWELGLNFQIPIGNDAARARLREAILARTQRLSTREAREQAIRQEVLNALDTIDGTWQRILAARQAVILNTRALLAEQRQFDVGSSTSTNVLDQAARLADAQSAEIRALTDHEIAQIDLAFATGTLLGADKVSWEPVNAPSTDGPDPAETLSPGS
ncbi:MAG: TolC family protein [Phycisphaerae bacterium]|nr:TolC family protein [Phycisphaerae bacterium]